MTTAKVAISADFLTAFAHLPRQVQGKVTELVNKFRYDPASPGIHYEKINSCIDKKYIPFVSMMPTAALSFVNPKFICFYGSIITMRPTSGPPENAVK